MEHSEVLVPDGWGHATLLKRKGKGKEVFFLMFFDGTVDGSEILLTS